MGCVMSDQSESGKGNKCTQRLLKQRRRQSYDGGGKGDEARRRPDQPHDRCRTIIVPQLVRAPRGYYNGRRTATSSYEESSEEQYSSAAGASPFGPWKGHRFVGHRNPSSPAVVSDSWSFAVGSPATSFGSPVMFSEVWSKQGKRNLPPPVVIDEATEMELKVEGGEFGSPLVDPPGFSSSPERGKGNDEEDVVGVFRRRKKSGSVGEPMFMEAFVFD